ncbi:hypothetical protein [Actinorhabdospora filicis]|uniref:hypothetical protein n=1 Tax=Actinorhabdospora filicis TaxID=1785913 RepID=UPI002555252A|nr:hypothetical protein [Actinorhabdospora filicis]
MSPGARIGPGADAGACVDVRPAGHEDGARPPVIDPRDPSGGAVEAVVSPWRTPVGVALALAVAELGGAAFGAGIGLHPWPIPRASSPSPASHPAGAASPAAVSDTCAPVPLWAGGLRDIGDIPDARGRPNRHH